MTKKISKAIIKGLAIVFLALLLVFLFAIFYFKSTNGQKMLSKIVISELSIKLKTPVSGNISYSFPDWLKIENLLIKDQQSDTLLYSKNAYLDVDMWALVKDNQLKISKVDLKNSYLNVYDVKGKFNYEPILEAFASKDTIQKANSSSIEISLNKIFIEKLSIRFKDSNLKHSLLASIKSANTGFNILNPSKNIYDLKPIIVDGLNVSGEIGNLASKKSDKTASTLVLALNKIKLRNANLNLAFNSKTYSAKDLNLAVDFNKLDIKKNSFELAEIYSDASNISIKNQNHKKGQTNQIDFEDLAFSDFNLSVESIKIDSGNIDLRVEKLLFKEKSGFEIKKLNTDLKYENNVLAFQNLVLATGSSQLSANVKANINKQDLAKSEFFLNLKTSDVAVSETKYFSNKIFNNEYLRNLKNEKIIIKGELFGTAKSVNFKDFIVQTPKTTNAKFTGKIIDFENPFFDFSTLKLITTKADLLSIIPKNNLPKNLNLPDKINIDGKAKGKIADLTTVFIVATNKGNATINANIKHLGTNTMPIYSGRLALKNFQAGNILTYPSLGNITSDFSFSGKGFDPKTALIIIKGDVNEVIYDGKLYKNISIDGKLQDQIFDSKIAINQDGAKVNWEGSVDLKSKDLTILGKTNVESLDLKALGFSDQNIEIKGNFDIKQLSLNPKSPLIDLTGKNVKIFKDNKLYPIGDLSLITSTDANNRKLFIETNFAKVEASGNFEYDQLKNVILNEINRYFKLPDFKESTTNQYLFKVDGRVSYDPIFTAFLPKLQDFSPISVQTLLRSEGNIPISGKISVPYLFYDSVKVNNTFFDFFGDGVSLKYFAKTEEISNYSFRVRNGSLEGKLEDNVADFNLAIKDSLDTPIHALSGFVKSIDDKIRLSFNEDGTLLFYEPWAGNPYGYLDYSSKGILMQDVIFTSKNQIVRLNSVGETPNGPLKIFTENINLNNLAKAFLRDSTFISGTLESDIVIKNYMDAALAFTGDFKIKDLIINEIALGMASGKAETDNDKDILLETFLKGENSDLKLFGTYHPEKKEGLEFKLEATKIDAKLLTKYSEGVLSNISGNLSSVLSIEGSIDKPIIEGFGMFENFNFKLVETGATLKIDDQKFKFKESKILFEQTSITDIKGKKMTLDGEVSIEKLPDFTYKFDINAKDFFLIDAQQDENELYFGQGYFDAKMKLIGQNLDFKLTGNVNVGPNTDLTLLLADDSKLGTELETIVQFVDFKDLLNTKKKTITKKPKLSFANAVNINLEVTEKAKLNILMDQVTGDLMKVKGNGKMNIGFDNKGDLFIIGKYDIIDGSYNLTYQAFKKEFLIKKASQSNITWVGDPLNGKLFIRASNYLGRKSLSKYPFEKNSKLANNTLNVPLQVDLVMTEYLVSPKIDFELVLKEADLGSDAKDLETYGFTVINDKDVKIDNTKNSETAGDSQKIVNKEEIKKQAIIMLMFGYFSTYLEGDKIVESFKDVNNFENKAREKASDLITSQLNKYGAGLIKGLDLDFGLQSGLNTANNSRNTNLSVGASKKLANERLIITVGKNFELENKGVKSDQIFDNLQANWVITKDGRYRLNLFRKNRNQMVIEGQVVETGFGFILAFDYDTWKELRKKK